MHWALEQKTLQRSLLLLASPPKLLHTSVLSCVFNKIYPAHAYWFKDLYSKLCADLKNEDLLLVQWYVWHSPLPTVAKTVGVSQVKKKQQRIPCVHLQESVRQKTSLWGLSQVSSPVGHLFLLACFCSEGEKRNLYVRLTERRETFQHCSCGAMCLINKFASILCQFWSREFLSLISVKKKQLYSVIVKY